MSAFDDLFLETKEETRIDPDSSALDTGSFSKDGWGIIKNSGGLSRMPSQELVDVIGDEEAADERAKNLNATEGYSHPMEGGDIEDEYVTFSAQQVTLKGITRQVTLHAEYEIAEGEPK
jgi:hypothetical protein